MIRWITKLLRGRCYYDSKHDVYVCAGTKISAQSLDSLRKMAENEDIVELRFDNETKSVVITPIEIKL